MKQLDTRAFISCLSSWQNEGFHISFKSACYAVCKSA